MKRILFLAAVLAVFTLNLTADEWKKTEARVDWQKMDILYTLRVRMDRKDPRYKNDILRETAKDMIKQEMGAFLEGLVVDDSHFLGDFLKDSNSFSEHYSIFMMNRDISSFFIQGNILNTSVFVKIRGKDSLLAVVPLPWNTEKYPILQDDTVNPRFYQTSGYFPADHESVTPEAFDSILVDVSEMDIRPALAPRVYTDSGRLIYGPEFLQKRYGVERGIVTYVEDYNNVKEKNRLGKNPFITVALSVSGKNMTDVVISDKDASRFLAEKKNVENLLKCRVVFLIKK